MFDCKVTLFNYHAKTKKWYTTVFAGVDLLAADAKQATPKGETNGSSVDLLINVMPDKSYEGKQYMGPKAYAATVTPADCFTFTPETDFFMEGDYSMAEPVSEDDYESGYYHEMNNVHDGVHMVVSAAYFPLIPHFEIGGR
jgi:hypothetical protein